jgi:hypothetical protein
MENQTTPEKLKNNPEFIRLARTLDLLFANADALNEGTVDWDDLLEQHNL